MEQKEGTMFECLPEGMSSLSCVDHTGIYNSLTLKNGIFIFIMVFLISLMVILGIRSGISRILKFKIHPVIVIVLCFISAGVATYKTYEASEYTGGYYTITLGVNSEADMDDIDRYYRYLTSFDIDVNVIYDDNGNCTGFFLVQYYKNIDRDLVSKAELREEAKYHKKHNRYYSDSLDKNGLEYFYK